ncbi:MAG: GFA family protein [Gammaproteobacteria bacterium]|nr:GFA family protein [Gammaproteobacteria bacterium]
MSSSTTNHPYTGQCLCGSIKYQVDKIEPKIAHCHCSMCRKFHGAAFATFGEAVKKNFHWLEGKSLLKSYVASNRTTRQFCNNCGSSLTFLSPAFPHLVEFSLGTLDSNITLKPDAHIFTGSKACWYDITDKLPQYKEWRKE